MPGRNVWLATALLNDRVRNSAGENIGKIEDVVIDPDSGAIRYAVVSLAGVIGDKLIAVPWFSMSVSPFRDYLVLNMDGLRFEGAPAFDRNHWPDMADPIWQRSIHDYYGPAPAAAPVVRERTVYVEKPRGQGLSALGTILFACLLFGLIWVIFLVGTRGWDQARQDIENSVQSAAYAAKETSQDAAIT